MKDKIQKLIAEIIGDGFTVEVKPVSGGNVSSDFGAGVTTYMSVYTDGEGDQAIYVNGKLEVHQVTIYATELARVADGRLVRMRSAVLDDSLRQWPENESELQDVIGGYQSGFDAGATVGAPHQDGLALRSEWNNEQGCFEDSIVDPGKYSEWEPKIDGWVRLPEGKVAKVKCVKVINGAVLYGFHGTNIMYTLGALKPWKPKCGDWVKITRPPCGEDIAVARWYWTAGLDHLDGETHQVTRISSGANEGFQVREIDGSGLWLSLSWLEPAESPKEETANPSETPNSSTWVPKVGDKVRVVRYEGVLCGNTGVIKHVSNCMAWTLSEHGGHAGWLRFKDLALIEAAAPADHISDTTKTANPSEPPSSSKPDPLNCIGHICDLSEPTGVTCPVDSCDLDTGLRDMPSQEPEYREPTYADLANGPIEVEVSDDGTCEVEAGFWNKKVLYGILPLASGFPYLAGVNGDVAKWRHARIKVN